MKLSRTALSLFLVFQWMTISASAFSKDLAKAFSLPKRPSDGAPISVSIQQNDLYALYWTKLKDAYHLTLTRYDRRTRSAKSMELSREREVVGVRQSLIVTNSGGRLVYLVSIPKSQGVFASIVGVVDLGSDAIQASLDLGTLGLSGPADLIEAMDDHISIVQYSSAQSSDVSTYDFQVPTLRNTEHRRFALPVPVGTLSSARKGNMLWFSPYGLMMASGGGRIVGVHLTDSDKKINPVTINLASGSYLTGLRAFGNGLLAVINRGTPDGSQGTGLIVFDGDGGEISRLDVDSGCALGSPTISFDDAVGVARCVRLKSDPFDRYRVSVDKFVIFSLKKGVSSVSDSIDGPGEPVSAFSISGVHDGLADLAVVAGNGDVFLSR